VSEVAETNGSAVMSGMAAQTSDVIVLCCLYKPETVERGQKGRRVSFDTGTSLTN
jgi:hypothetical protein